MTASGGPSAAAELAAKPADLAAATQAAITSALARIERLTASVAAPGASGPQAIALLDLYDEAVAELDNLSSTVGLIANAHPDGVMRDAADAAEQQLSEALNDLSLNADAYRALAALDVRDEDAGTRHYLDKVLLTFRRAGVDRDEATRGRIRRLQDELVAVGQAFDRNIRTDTKVAELAPEALDGLPDDYVRAHPAGEDGLVRITTAYPDYIPFQTYARDGRARERLWRLFHHRGHPANIDVLRQLVERRHELATLLGYPSWAAYATEDTMMGGADAAADFIEGVTEAARARSARDYEALLACKRREDPDATTVHPWDLHHLEDRLKKEELAFDTRAVRPYFEYTAVKAGLMALAGRMFGLEFRARPDLPVWHPDVEAYDVLGEGAGLMGRIFLDMHPRPDKFMHAAMRAMVNGKAGRRVPECALLCNLPRPGEEPALLQHSEVTTFFHEFGHLIHHVVGGHQRWHGTSGITMEWDFVEAPSKLLEEWTIDAGTLASFAVHHETGEPLPAEFVTNLRAAEEFGKGLAVCRQMFLASMSLEFHRHDPATLDPVAIERTATQAHTPFGYVDDTYLHLSFPHLNGYSALYYTYMWSQVIAKDLFTRFAEEGLPSPGTCRAYRDTVLAAGGRAPAAETVRAFLGRSHTFEAYRRWLDAGGPAGPEEGRPATP